jgi:putative tryptophan/tyrosine transport system substrate-binding protein
MASHIERRKFLATLGSAAAWPLAARAQDQMRRIGVLLTLAESDLEMKALLTAFQERLQQLGWAAGRNVWIDYRLASGDEERLKTYAAELLRMAPDVLFCQGVPELLALHQQTRTLPIVFVQVSDPVSLGFVANLARPGGNVTGFIFTEPTMAGKWLELLKQIAPGIARVAMLFNPVSAPYAEYWLSPFKAAAASFAVEAVATPVHDSSELASVVAAQAREPNGGLIVMPDSFTDAHRVEITSLAARYRLPAIYPFRFFAEAGGLLSYGVDRADNFRRAAAYVDRILKGEKPGELPVQAPTKYETVVNLKAARALGLQIPDKVLALADEVIE